MNWLGIILIPLLICLVVSIAFGRHLRRQAIRHLETGEWSL